MSGTETTPASSLCEFPDPAVIEDDEKLADLWHEYQRQARLAQDELFRRALRNLGNRSYP